DPLDDDSIYGLQGIESSVVDLAVLAVPTRGEDDAEEPVLITKGIHRVAARFTNDTEHVERSSKMTAGRLAVARMVGDDTNARRAHLGLIEIAVSVCRPADPACPRCPLNQACSAATTAGNWRAPQPVVSP
ncbi:DNA cytosine methyltransferase, partial [Micromonospora fluostatini]